MQFRTSSGLEIILPVPPFLASTTRVSGTYDPLLTPCMFCIEGHGDHKIDVPRPAARYDSGHICLSFRRVLPLLAVIWQSPFLFLDLTVLSSLCSDVMLPWRPPQVLAAGCFFLLTDNTDFLTPS